MNISVKALVIRKGKFLILKPAQGKGFMGWDGPGGMVKKGESLLEAVEREIREETGLQLIEAVPFKTLVLPNDDKNYLIFLCRVKEGLVRLSQEHLEYKWATLEEFFELTSFSLLREIKNFKQTQNRLLKKILK